PIQLTAARALGRDSRMTNLTTQHSDRDELVELMSRYANIPDANGWDELPPLVFCEEFFADFRALGPPAATVPREEWAAQGKQTSSGLAATHHAITNHLVSVDGDRASIRAHAHVEHWVSDEVVAGGPNCYLIAGFYDTTAVRTSEGWRLDSIK